MPGIFIRKPATALTAGAVGSDLVRLSLRKIGTSTFATGSDWTPGAGDVKVSKDGGAQANITTPPSYSNGSWEFTLSATELTAKQVRVVAANAAIESDDFTVDLDRSYAQNELRRIHGVSGTVWCVTPGGNDSTGDGLTFDTAYATPGKAKSVGAAGDLGLVAAGTYTAGDLLKDGFNWHFMPGAKVYSTSQDSGIFNDSAAACVCRITGRGQFRHDADTQACINITRNATDLDVECESLSLGGTGNGGTLTPVIMAVGLTTARLRLLVHGDVTNPWYDGMILDGGRVDITVRGKIESTAPSTAGGEALELGGASGVIRAGRLNSTGSAAIFSTGADVLIDCPDIRGAGGDFYTAAVEVATVAATSDSALRIRNARIVGDNACRAVHFHAGDGTFGNLILENVRLESGASDAAASAVAAQVIRVLGRVTSDKAIGTNVTARYDTVFDQPGDLQGKILGGGSGTITGTGVRSDLRQINGVDASLSTGVPPDAATTQTLADIKAVAQAAGKQR